MCRYPHDDLVATEQVSLLDFTRTALEMSQVNPDDWLSYAKYVLAGRSTDDHFITVNALQEAHSPDINECNMTRDYDSIIGVSHDLPFLVPLSIYPVPPFQDILRKDNHIKVTIEDDEVSIIYRLWL
jgi:hypothetical protein